MTEVENSNRLAVLAGQIRGDIAEMRKGAEAMATRALAVGAALVEAKEGLSHGEWGLWLRTNCALSERSARRYMQLVREGVKTATVADLGIRGALEPSHRDGEAEFMAWLREGCETDEQLEQVVGHIIHLAKSKSGWAAFIQLLKDKRANGQT